MKPGATNGHRRPPAAGQYIPLSNLAKAITVVQLSHRDFKLPEVSSRLEPMEELDDCATAIVEFARNGSPDEARDVAARTLALLVWLCDQRRPAAKVTA